MSVIVPALRRPIIVWDLVLSILLTLLGLGIGALVSLSSIFLVMAADSCGGSRECNLPQLTGGWLIAMIGPSVVMLVTLVLTVVRLVRRRMTWWLPLTGIVVELLVWWGAVSLVFASVPGPN
ncbi:hypothetical protein FVP33_03045 [Lacisediminihabitans profunda]|uniref:Uncharacterized protein n=1 Tax=Lacisediminihabitans profunda TaxID=2594790 RepID=A0A5C8UTH0_9MICO|nr:hypothetical protein FVP33_03045 [Lacisediminihabitans profunda]